MKHFRESLSVSFPSTFLSSFKFVTPIMDLGNKGDDYSIQGASMAYSGKLNCRYIRAVIFKTVAEKIVSHCLSNNFVPQTLFRLPFYQ